jgi:hypothetical protein
MNTALTGYLRLKILHNGQWAVMRGYGMKATMMFRGSYEDALAKLSALRK